MTWSGAAAHRRRGRLYDGGAAGREQIGIVVLSGYRIRIEYAEPIADEPSPGAALVISLSRGEFVVTGMRCRLDRCY
jgi:hypothetical protein